MFLKQNSEGYWVVLAVSNSNEESHGELAGVHSTSLCEGRGCAIHNHPSDHPLNAALLFWRESLPGESVIVNGVLDRFCKHGQAHTDYDSARYLESINERSMISAHNCDGCCVGANR